MGIEKYNQELIKFNVTSNKEQDDVSSESERDKKRKYFVQVKREHVHITNVCTMHKELD